MKQANRKSIMNVLTNYASSVMLTTEDWKFKTVKNAQTIPKIDSDQLS
jgi:hypothetical protein